MLRRDFFTSGSPVCVQSSSRNPSLASASARSMLYPRSCTQLHFQCCIVFCSLWSPFRLCFFVFISLQIVLMTERLRRSFIHFEDQAPVFRVYEGGVQFTDFFLLCVFSLNGIKNKLKILKHANSQLHEIFGNRKREREHAFEDLHVERQASAGDKTHNARQSRLREKDRFSFPPYSLDVLSGERLAVLYATCKVGHSFAPCLHEYPSILPSLTSFLFCVCAFFFRKRTKLVKILRRVSRPQRPVCGKRRARIRRSAWRKTSWRVIYNAQNKTTPTSRNPVASLSRHFRPQKVRPTPHVNR